MTAERWFGRFEEYNDHEGERWNWWLQLDGNKDELDKFVIMLDTTRDYAESVGYDFEYTVHAMDVEPESVVDKLVQYAGVRYYASHNKVVGTFRCPGDYDWEELYKGGIREYFREEQLNA